MAQDWLADVRKYAPDADPAVVDSIADDCGIALNDRDGSLVAFTDPAETARIRDGFCRKKLALTDPDPVIDTAIARVGERMAGDTTRNRVTVYYLLAEAFGKLGVFGAATTAAVAGASAAAATTTSATAATMTSAPPATVAAVPPGAPPRSAPAPMAAAPAGTNARLQAVAFNQTRARGDNVILPGCAILGAVFLLTAGLSTFVGTRPDPVVVAADADLTAPVTATTTAVAVASAVAAATPPIPVGAGVTAQDIAGKPSLSVYFDTAKKDIAPDFAGAAAPVKAWMDSHPGDRLGVSGFNDPRGNAAFNAELSKNRAQAVAAALAALGVPAASIDLDKPPETTDTETSQANARRVDVVVKGAS